MKAIHNYNIPVHAHVFVFTEDQLKEINIKRIFFDNILECDETFEEFRIESDRLKGYVKLSDIYDSVEDYLNGIPCSNLIVEPFDEECYKGRPHGANNSTGYYYIEDNQVKHLNVDEMPTAYYEFDESRFYSNSFRGREFFPTKEYASKFLDVEVNKADGTIERAKGINRLLLLDSDQRKLIKQLQEIVDKINESDILLYSDCDGNYFAYNTRELEDFEITDDDRWIEQQHGCTYECSGEFAGEFEVDLNIPCNGTYDLVYAKRKK